MGLYIHTPLESINVHRKLLQLERGAEIATGIMRLQQLLEEKQEKPLRLTPQLFRALQGILQSMPESAVSDEIESIGEELVTYVQKSRGPAELDEGELLEPFYDQSEGEIGQPPVEEPTEGVDLSPDHALQYLLTLRRAQREEPSPEVQAVKGPVALNADEQRLAYHQKIEAAWTRMHKQSEVPARKQMRMFSSFLKSFPADHRFGNPHQKEAETKIAALREELASPPQKDRGSGE